MGQQQMEALSKANRVRHARKEAKARLRARTESAAAYILEPPEYAAKVKLIDFLQWVPRVGPERAKAIIRSSCGRPTLGRFHLDALPDDARVALAARVGVIHRAN